MGFWSSVWNGVKNVAKTAAAVAVAPVVLPLAAGVWAVEKIQDSFKSKTEEVSKEISKTEALTESSGVRQVENMSDLLRQYSTRWEDEARGYEKQCQNQVDLYFNDLIERMEGLDGISDDVGLEQLKRKQRRIKNSIQDSITDPLSMRLSLDDSTCRQILSKPRGASRDREIRKYSERVLREALNDLSDRTCDALKSQWDETADFFKEHMKRQEKEADRQRKLLEQWESDMESDKFNKEKARLEPTVKLYAIQQIQKLIEV